MNDEPDHPSQGAPQVEQALTAGLDALSRVSFSDSDAGEIVRVATAAVSGLGPFQVEAIYRSENGEFIQFPPSQAAHRDIERHRRSNWDGQVTSDDGRWGWAFPLRHQSAINGCLVVSATSAPSKNATQLLIILAQQTGAALAHAATHDRDSGDAAQLTKSIADLKVANRELAATVMRLQGQTKVHEALSATLAAGTGEQGIAQALNELTGHSVAIEDRSGNLRCRAGPGLPHPYLTQGADQRELVLHQLAAENGRARIGRRVLALIQHRAEILGVLALDDPDDTVTEDNLFALDYGASVLALELSHQQTVAEIEFNLGRAPVDDLLAGTDRDGKTTSVVGGGEVEGFVREWLGTLLDYDDSKHAELVMTLSVHLECGGNYDESAAALHIHRSTLRYRLTRIAELTGHDLRNVDTRFNLHAATRAWRFLKPDG